MSRSKNADAQRPVTGLPGLPTPGRTSRRGQLFYLLGVVIVGGSIAAGTLIAVLGAGSSGGGGAGGVAAPGPSTNAATGRGDGGDDGVSPVTIDTSKTYTAVLKTEKGDITIRLRPDLAPNHVQSFISLARDGFYDGVTFHRVIPGFVAQTGDPTGTGGGGPGYTLDAEFSDVPFVAGTIGMARAASPNSAGSQFFITYGRAPSLDGQYTVFGEVTEGMSVALALTPRDPSTRPNAPPGDKLLDVEIIES